MADKRHLNNPPIVEAILDFQCEMPGDYKIDTLDKRGMEAFGDRYPISKHQKVQKLVFENLRAGTPPTTSSSIQSLRYLDAEGKQLVQLRSSGFSCNRLAPYPGWAKLEPEFLSAWAIFRNRFCPLQLNELKLRFINRLELPALGGIMDLDEYFDTGPRLPAGSALDFTGFNMTYHVLDVPTQNKATVTIGTEVMKLDRLNLIFDIQVQTPSLSPNIKDVEIIHRIDTLRHLKNHLFFGSLTEKCVSLYQ